MTNKINTLRRDSSGRFLSDRIKAGRTYNWSRMPGTPVRVKRVCSNNVAFVTLKGNLFGIAKLSELETVNS